MRINGGKRSSIFFFGDDELSEIGAEGCKKKSDAVIFFDDECEPDKNFKDEGKADCQESMEPLIHRVKKNAIRFDTTQKEPQYQEKYVGDALKKQVTIPKVQSDIVKVETGLETNVVANSQYRTNISLQALEIVSALDRNGREIFEKSILKLQVTVTVHNLTKCDVLEIALSKLDSLIPTIRKRIPCAVVNPKDTDLIDDIREQTINLHKVCVCSEAGWNNIDGQMVYCFKERSIYNRINEIKLGLGIQNGLQKDVISMIVWNALNLYRDSGKMYVMMLFSLLGILFRLFSDAGYPIRFLLFIHGKTGSYKTAMAKVLYLQLLEESERNKVRRLDQDTLTSLERGLVKNGVDTITLFDDFRPPQTERQKSNMQDNLESIIRMVGDGSSKSRSNASLEDVRGEGVKGAVVVTGEMKGSGHSSNLRCLKVLIEKEQVNLNVLTWFQNNFLYYNSFVGKFASFVENNWNEILQKIGSNYPQYRTLCSQDLAESRLIDAETTLMITADIFETFCASVLGFEDEKKEWIKNARQQLHIVFKRNEEDSSEEDPIALFMDSLDYLVSNNVITLARDWNCAPNKDAIDGFWENNYLFLKPENIYTKVCKHLGAIGKSLNISFDSLFKLLAQERIIELAKNGGKNTTLYFRRKLGQGKRIKLIKMNQSRLYCNKEGGSYEYKS